MLQERLLAETTPMDPPEVVAANPDGRPTEVLLAALRATNICLGRTILEFAETGGIGLPATADFNELAQDAETLGGALVQSRKHQ